MDHQVGGVTARGCSSEEQQSGGKGGESAWNHKTRLIDLVVGEEGNVVDQPARLSESGLAVYAWRDLAAPGAV